MPRAFPRTICYDMATPPLELRFWKTWERFAAHVHDHFLSATENWTHVLGTEFMAGFCQGLDVLGVDLLEALYERLVDVLDKGIRSALKRPVWIRCRRTITPRAGKTWRVQGFTFLAAEGFRVEAEGGTVKTALFPPGLQAASRLHLCQENWRLIRSRYRKGHVEDIKHGQRIAYAGVKYISPDNWAICPFGQGPKRQGPHPAWEDKPSLERQALRNRRQVPEVRPTQKPYSTGTSTGKGGTNWLQALLDEQANQQGENNGNG